MQFSTKVKIRASLGLLLSLSGFGMVIAHFISHINLNFILVPGLQIPGLILLAFGLYLLFTLPCFKPPPPPPGGGAAAASGGPGGGSGPDSDNDNNPPPPAPQRLFAVLDGRGSDSGPDNDNNPSPPAPQRLFAVLVDNLRALPFMPQRVQARAITRQLNRVYRGKPIMTLKSHLAYIKDVLEKPVQSIAHYRLDNIKKAQELNIADDLPIGHPLICPLSGELITHPVQLTEGTDPVICDYKSLFQWITANGEEAPNPFTREKINLIQAAQKLLGKDNPKFKELNTTLQNIIDKKTPDTTSSTELDDRQSIQHRQYQPSQQLEHGLIHHGPL